jgi:hypothetical protein
MAGIALWRNDQEMDYNQVKSCHNKLGYKGGVYFQLADWSLLIFQKKLFDISNWYKIGDDFICAIGTYSYKRKFYDKGLPLVMEDVRKNNIDYDAFKGSFVIVAMIEGRFYMLRDGGLLIRLYKQKDKPVVFSSFVALLRSLPQKANLNSQAIVELLSTGLITNHETIIKDIEFLKIDEKIPGFQLSFIEPSIPSKPGSYKKALNQQVELSKTYTKEIIEDWNNYMPKANLNLSITGGLDSRYLTSLVSEFDKDFSFYSYWRTDNDPDKDFVLAKNIAKKLGNKLYYKQIKKFKDLCDDEKFKLLEETHNSSDGVIRPGSFWDEEFSSLNYRAKLCPGPYLRLTGFEGEFYRNMERLPLKSNRSIKSWVRYEMINRFAGSNFLDVKQKQITEERITSYMKNKGYKNLNLLSFKKYYRTTVVPSYRSLQNHLENRMGFIISPFADVQLSKKAVLAYPYVGSSIEFEVDMLNQVNLELAKLPNDYNIDFSKGADIKMSFASSIWQKLPPKLKHSIFNKIRKKSHKNSYIEDLVKDSPLISRLIGELKELDIPFDFESFASRSTRGRLLLNFSFFIHINQNYIKS